MIDANQFFQGLLISAAKAFGATAEPNADGTATITKVSGDKTDRHLVLVPNTAPCPVKNCQNFGEVGKCFDALPFHSIVAAETARCKLKRRHGVDIRIYSGAKACETYKRLLAEARISLQSKELVEFLTKLYAEAKSLQHN